MQRLLLIAIILFNLSAKGQRGYVVQYDLLAKPTVDLPPIQTNFNNQNQATTYLNKLNSYLRGKGFLTANLDSVKYNKETAKAILFIGNPYILSKVDASSVPNNILIANGWDINAQRGLYNFDKLYKIQERLSDYYQNQGYAFVKVSVDSLAFHHDSVHAKLIVDTGILYRIDSIRNLGRAKIKKTFLYQYLNVKPKSIYKKSALDNISKKVSLLPYVTELQPYSLSMQNSSAVLNVYLQPKKSSIVNVLLGVIPAPNPNGLTNVPQNKLFLSGDANVLLNNSLSFGETIGLTFQQLSINSRRINLLYKVPYVFKSNYGIETSFELYKRDSSFINAEVALGLRYSLGDFKNGKIFVQQLTTNVTPDTLSVIATKRLPANLDVKIINIGSQYELNTTDNIRTPTKGNHLTITAAFGSKKITKSAAITNIKAPGFNYAGLFDSVKLNTYQLKTTLTAAHYLPIGKQSVLKLGMQAGYLQSQNYLRNELFQIGGFKTLRGFDEESQFCNQYVVPTVEWRYLIGNDSYFFAFVDGGYTKNQVFESIQHTYIGTGAGLSFSTKTGIFNLSVAAGGRNDIRLGLKQSKLHFGYLSVF